MVDDERVWLTHPEHGGHFHCPVGAVEAWAEMGWEPADGPPEEHNPVIAENLAARAEAAAQADESKKPRMAVKAAAANNEEG